MAEGFLMRRLPARIVPTHLLFPLEVMTRTKSPIGMRLREWRALNQHSETYAITLIRRQWLAMTPARLLELEAGAEPTPEEYFILDDMLPAG